MTQSRGRPAAGKVTDGEYYVTRGLSAYKPEISTAPYGHTGHFLERAGSILPEKYGAAPEKWTPELTWLNKTRQESLSKSIVENRRRTYIYIHTVLLSSIFVKHALNSHFAARKIARLPEKKYFARLWKGCSPPAHAPMPMVLTITRLFLPF